MKRVLLNATFLLLMLSAPVLLSFTQEALDQAPPFEVNRMRPFVSIDKSQLAKANTLLDINPRYNADWVKTYKSVEVTTMQQGSIHKVLGKSGTLTPEQKAQLATADLGTEIKVLVHYMPENNLSHNDLQEMGFLFTVEADRDAKFQGGMDQLKEYLNDKAISQLSAETFGEWGMSAVKFTVDSKGHVGAVEAIEPLQDSIISALLVETICNMPQWEPARFDNGTTVDQHFALTVGNQANCKIPLLNIRDL